MAQSDVMQVVDGTSGVAGHAHEDGLAHKKLAVQVDPKYWSTNP